MANAPYTLDPDDPTAPPIGLIVLQTDETLESDFRHYFAGHPSPFYVSRIPSGREVSTETLAAMQADLASAADLLPKARAYPVVGYGCTSASSVIGSEEIERLVQRTCDTAVVTNPLRAAIACAESHGISKLAILSPYVEEVNEPLRQGFSNGGVSTEAFSTFGEPEEAKVVRISTKSVVDAAVKLGSDTSVEGVFLSCTNLRTLEAIPAIEEVIGKPVLSSNQSLAWHIKALVSK